MFLYGFEVEGFYFDGAVSEGSSWYGIPPPQYPTDGFPGLVEFRSMGGKSIWGAYAEIVANAAQYPFVDIDRCEFQFTGEQMATLRRRREFGKETLDVRNIYGKQPRRLGNKTLAAFQINVSNQLSPGYTGDNGVKFPPQYGLLDVYKIVKRLDDLFEKQIKDSKRQKGMYSIKDGIRLEYRSAPNFAFPNVKCANEILIKIKEAVEND